MFVTPPSRKNTAKARISTTLVPPPPLPGRSAALGSTLVATLGANAMSLSHPCFLAIPRPVLSFCGGRARQILAHRLAIRNQQRRGKTLVGLARHRIVDLEQLDEHGVASSRGGWGQYGEHQVV